MQFQGMIKNMLVRDPKERISMENVYSILDENDAGAKNKESRDENGPWYIPGDL